MDAPLPFKWHDLDRARADQPKVILYVRSPGNTETPLLLLVTTSVVSCLLFSRALGGADAT